MVCSKPGLIEESVLFKKLGGIENARIQIDELTFLEADQELLLIMSQCGSPCQCVPAA